MVLLSALILAVAATSGGSTPPAAGARAHATASIKILSAASLRFDELERTEPTALRETQVRSADGSVQQLKVVEFQ
jgi:ABC-type molybdate transport system substrate-binding protein